VSKFKPGDKVIVNDNIHCLADGEKILKGSRGVIRNICMSYVLVRLDGKDYKNAIDVYYLDLMPKKV